MSTLTPDPTALLAAVQAVRAETHGAYGDLAVTAVNAYVHAIDREVKAQVWDEGQLAGRNNEHHTNWATPIPNPYRDEEA